MSTIDYPILSYAQISARLGMCVLLSGAVGIQRELEGHAAGLRTHMMVALGSALFTLVSAFGFQDFNNVKGFVEDPGRIAAQVVSGIGFLGGGAIMKQGLDVKGLTTAATIWVVSAIGMATALNFWFPATLATLVVLFTLEVFKRLETFYWSKINIHRLRIENIDNIQLTKIVSLLSLNSVEINSIIREKSTKPGAAGFNVTISITLPKYLSHSSPQLMVNIVKGVEGLTLTNVVLMDGKRRGQWMTEIRGKEEEGIELGEGFVEHSKKLQKKEKKKRKERSGVILRLI